MAKGGSQGLSLYVNKRMDSTIKPFIVKSAEITTTLINVFNERLGLPEGALAKRHRLEELSFCQSRCIKKPACIGNPPDGPVLGEHTDYGSIVSKGIVTKLSSFS